MIEPLFGIRKSRRPRERLDAARCRDRDSVESKPGKASNYIRHFRALLNDGFHGPVLLYCRVSEREQHRRGNAKDQEKVLWRKCKKFGIGFSGVVRDIGPGWDVSGGSLPVAIKFARKHRSIVLAESTDRFLRHHEFHSIDNPNAVPTEEQFAELHRLAHGVVLATLFHPDKPWKEVRSLQTKRGQRRKAKGGRPRKRRPGFKKKRRMEFISQVRRLRRRGHSIAQISQRIGVPRSTVHLWLKHTGYANDTVQ
jgi:DNA invertase Pin-like site-specific DNA recombinase